MWLHSGDFCFLHRDTYSLFEVLFIAMSDMVFRVKLCWHPKCHRDRATKVNHCPFQCTFYQRSERVSTRCYFRVCSASARKIGSILLICSVWYGDTSTGRMFVQLRSRCVQVKPVHLLFWSNGQLIFIRSFPSMNWPQSTNAYSSCSENSKQIYRLVSRWCSVVFVKTPPKRVACIYQCTYLQGNSGR